MAIALTLLGALSFPVAGLFLLLWLTRLEDTLPRAVELSLREPPPPPILAIPVSAPTPTGTSGAVTTAWSPPQPEVSASRAPVEA